MLYSAFFKLLYYFTRVIALCCHLLIEYTQQSDFLLNNESSDDNDCYDLFLSCLLWYIFLKKKQWKDIAWSFHMCLWLLSEKVQYRRCSSKHYLFLGLMMTVDIVRRVT